MAQAPQYKEAATFIRGGTSKSMFFRLLMEGWIRVPQ